MWSFWLWAGGLFLVAAVALWWSMRDPKYLAQLIAVAARAAWKALAPAILRRKPPEEEALWREAVKRGEDPGPVHGHRGKD